MVKDGMEEMCGKAEADRLSDVESERWKDAEHSHRAEPKVIFSQSSGDAQ